MNQSILGAKYCLVNRLVRVDYRTTNLTTSKGRALRTVTLDRRGTASETAFGAADDVRPGWWVRERDGDAVLAKFFLDRRIQKVYACSLQRFERLDCVAHGLYMAEQEQLASDGAQPAAPVASPGGSVSSAGSADLRKRKPTLDLRTGSKRTPSGRSI